MNPGIIIGIVAFFGFAALAALYYKTFVVDRTTPAQKMAATKTSSDLVQRLDRSDASEKSRILP